MNTIYLDWAAAALPNQQALQLMHDAYADLSANPSSLHTPGKKAAAELKRRRALFAELIQCRPEQVIFTSGGTESNSIVLQSLIWKRRKGTVLISGIEHPSVYSFSQFLSFIGYSVRILEAPEGFIQADSLKHQLTEDTVMVCIMHTNNVIGSVQPIAELASIIRNFEKQIRRHIHFHVDAVQAFGKIHLSAVESDADSMSFSAHKIGGPKGIGALFLKKPISPLSPGGGQEYGIRPGTENLPAISAFTAAADASCSKAEADWKTVTNLKSLFIDSIKTLSWVQVLNEGAADFGKAVAGSIYSPYFLLASFSPIPAEVMLRVLNDNGIAVSAGSACSSRESAKRERVLTSMGFSSNIASGTVRFSFGPSITEDDVRRTAEIIKTEGNRMYQLLHSLG